MNKFFLVRAMKRKLTDKYEFGFFLGNDEYFIVNEQDFKIFELHNESVLLTNTTEYPIHCKFIYKLLPITFKLINLNDFVSFLTNTKIEQEIDFELWVSFLNYLHADKKYNLNLEHIAQDLNIQCPIMALKLWELFKIKCTNIDVLNQIPKINENIDFFVDHEYTAFIEEKFDGRDLYCPKELLNILDINHTIFCTNALAPDYVYCQYDSQEIIFLNSSESIHIKNQRVKIVVDILLKYHYIITKAEEHAYISAFPPPNTKLLTIQLYVEDSISSYLNNFIMKAEQWVISSCSSYFYSAIASHQWKHGILAKNEKHSFLLKSIGIKILNPEIMDLIECERMLSKCKPILNPSISLIANKSILEDFDVGYYEIFNYGLFK